MSNPVKRAFEVSDGLASLTQKKLAAFLGELEKEGVLTKSEGAKARQQIGKAKTQVYDTLSRELKKIISGASDRTANRPVKRAKKARR